MGSRRLLIQHINNVWQTPYSTTNYENLLTRSIIRIKFCLVRHITVFLWNVEQMWSRSTKSGVSTLLNIIIGHCRKGELHPIILPIRPWTDMTFYFNSINVNRKSYYRTLFRCTFCICGSNAIIVAWIKHAPHSHATANVPRNSTSWSVCQYVSIIHTISPLLSMFKIQ